MWKSFVARQVILWKLFLGTKKKVFELKKFILWKKFSDEKSFFFEKKVLGEIFVGEKSSVVTTLTTVTTATTV